MHVDTVFAYTLVLAYVFVTDRSIVIRATINSLSVSMHWVLVVHLFESTLFIIILVEIHLKSLLVSLTLTICQIKFVLFRILTFRGHRGHPVCHFNS